jgi:dTDP-4-amino-4,6-dideoxygalactose transaminase
VKKDKESHIKIPLIDLRAQYRTIRAQVQQAIGEVLASQQFILGPRVQRFEERAAAYLDCRYAIGVASGSDALLLSLMALGIGAGDAVLVPPFTFFSTVSSITRLGATPIFVDIDPESCLLDPKKVEAVLVERCRYFDGQLIEQKNQLRVKAILPVHLFGQCCPMAPLLSLARRHALHIVEDVAQALGAQAKLSPAVSKAAGTLGDLGCFSFFPTKNLGGIGDGGLVATNKRDLAEKVRTLRVHGQSSKYHHQAVGLNSRLDAIHAAVLLVKLRYLNRWLMGRIQRARRYDRLFSATGLVGNEIISVPALGNKKSHVFNHYVIRVRRRDQVIRYLRERGIQTEVYYPLPLHLQPCFRHLGYREGAFPNAERAASQVLALPMYSELALERQETVVQRIADFYRK